MVFVLATELDDATQLVADLFEIANGNFLPELLALDSLDDRQLKPYLGQVDAQTADQIDDRMFISYFLMSLRFASAKALPI